MAQCAFDHWFNTLADPSYAERCHRKRKLSQRKSPSGNFQIDEDVWARHPIDNVMYIASVIGIDKSNRSCRVTFVDDGQTSNLPFSDLRHITHEDVKRNRYVDYGHSWTEYTDMGAIVTYDRYGELKTMEFIAKPNIYDHSLADEEINSTQEVLPSATSMDVREKADLGTSSSIINVFLVRIPDPEDPTATYCNCPVWNASSYEEAEKKAFKLCNEDVDYQKAIQRAQIRRESIQQQSSSSTEALDGLSMPATSPTVESQSIGPDPPSVTEAIDLTKKPSVDSDLKQVITLDIPLLQDTKGRDSSDVLQIDSKLVSTEKEQNYITGEQSISLNQSNGSEKPSSIISLKSMGEDESHGESIACPLEQPIAETGLTLFSTYIPSQVRNEPQALTETYTSMTSRGNTSLLDQSMDTGPRLNLGTTTSTASNLTVIEHK
ncbi:unnamed protein product, partial [Rotaria sp. Silwood1]